MANSDKVLQASPIARRAKTVTNLTFKTVSANGFFIEIAGQRILQFESLPEANSFKTKLNIAISATKTQIKNSYETKIGDILDA